MNLKVFSRCLNCNTDKAGVGNLNDTILKMALSHCPSRVCSIKFPLNCGYLFVCFFVFLCFVFPMINA